MQRDGLNCAADAPCAVAARTLVVELDEEQEAKLPEGRGGPRRDVFSTAAEMRAGIRSHLADAELPAHLLREVTQ